uniref:Uncharacterized protein n=1 Tax=Oryza glumipatula TaxID=40148 RepID=A0A0E0ARL2_9ORYZ
MASFGVATFRFSPPWVTFSMSMSSPVHNRHLVSSIIPLLMASPVRHQAMPDEALKRVVGICTVGEGTRGWVSYVFPRNEALQWVCIVTEPEVHARQESVGRVVEALPYDGIVSQ